MPDPPRRLDYLTPVPRRRRRARDDPWFWVVVAVLAGLPILYALYWLVLYIVLSQPHGVG